MTPIQKLIDSFTVRLSHYEGLANQGVIPGVQDSYELEQIIGKIKEQKHILELLKGYDITEGGELTKQELECLHNAIDLQLKKIPMSEHNQSRREELLCKLEDMIYNYSERFCTDHQLVRLRLLSQKEYDFCETCLYIRRMR